SDPERNINPYSFLQLFLSFLHIVCYFTLLDRFFGFQLNDQWNLSSKSEGGEQSLWGAITAHSKFTRFKDNFLFDWSVEGAQQRYSGADRHQLDSHCFYINYITTGYSWRSKVTGHYWPRLSWRNLPTAFLSSCLGQYELDERIIRTSPSTFWQNDGSLSVYSQLPPPHQQVLMNISLNHDSYDPVKHKLQPGAWYNVYVEDRKKTLLFDEEPFLTTLPLVEDLLSSSDKAGMEWINKIETAEILESPTKLIYWMNRMQKLQTGSENAGDNEKSDGTLFSSLSTMQGS
ncbi:12877_t:CDS:2, partial [Acaulospora morrowiae]